MHTYKAVKRIVGGLWWHSHFGDPALDSDYVWDARDLYSVHADEWDANLWVASDPWMTELVESAARRGLDLVLWQWHHSSDDFRRAITGVFQGPHRKAHYMWAGYSLKIVNAKVCMVSVTNQRKSDADRLIAAYIVAQHKGRPHRECVCERLVPAGDDDAVDGVDVLSFPGYGKVQVRPVYVAELWRRCIADMPQQKAMCGRRKINALASNRFTIEHKRTYQDPRDDGVHGVLHHSRFYPSQLCHALGREVRQLAGIRNCKVLAGKLEQLFGLDDCTRDGMYWPMPKTITTLNEASHLVCVGAETKILEVLLQYLRYRDKGMVRTFVWRP